MIGAIVTFRQRHAGHPNWPEGSVIGECAVFGEAEVVGNSRWLDKEVPLNVLRNVQFKLS
jgi:hypothetical protein